MHITKCRKREAVEKIALRNLESIRTPGERENYKYLGILEADIIKQEEMKGKKTGERKSFSKLSYPAEISKG